MGEIEAKRAERLADKGACMSGRFPPEIAAKMFRGSDLDHYGIPAKAYCPRCNRVTATEVAPLSSGLWGNLCSACGACRKGRPYLSRKLVSALMAAPARSEGVHEDPTL